MGNVGKWIRLRQGYGVTSLRARLRLWERGGGGHTEARRGVDGVRGAVQIRRMKPLSNFVTLHPYFKVHPGELEVFKAGFPTFVEKTASEEKNIFYEFTVNGDEGFCREEYADAERLLAHLDNVGALLAEALRIAALVRLEVHGPAAELEKLRGPLAHL